MRLLKIGIVAAVLLMLFPGSVLASIITVDSSGGVLVNVLSEQDVALEIPRSDSLKVNELVGSGGGEKSSIALVRDDGRVKLTVDDNQASQTLDVTDISENVIEIEERPQTEKIAIKIENDKFQLIQEELTAITDYEIKVNPEIAGITLSTPSGFRFLSIFPKGAVETILRSKVMNKVNRSIELNEGSDGVLSYVISGERIINLFDLYEYSVPVKARVSASTAEVISIEQPEWLRILGFLFV